MVLHARGGSEGTFAEASSGAGKTGGVVEKLPVKSVLLFRRLFSSHTAAVSQSLIEYNICVCAHSIVHSCAWNERN